MIKKTTIISLLALTMSSGLASCATKNPPPPCYDGWTSNENGSSVIWTPNTLEEKAFETQIPDGHEVRCFHRTPDLKITAITESQRKLYYFEFEPVGEKFKLIDDGIISTHN